MKNSEDDALGASGSASLDAMLNHPGWDNVIRKAMELQPAAEVAKPTPPPIEVQSRAIGMMVKSMLLLLLIGGIVFIGSNAGAQSAFQSSLQQLVRIKSQEVLLRTQVLSEELSERGYLLHEFGGGARAECADIGSGALMLTCHQHTDLDELGLGKGSYAGINLYGNDVMTGTFSPIDLSRVERFDVEFRYPADTIGEFAIELKSIENYETNRMTLRAEGRRGEWQTFRVMEQPESKLLTDPSRRSSLITTISLFTDDFGRWGSRAQIEIRKIQIQLRGSKSHESRTSVR